MTERPEAAPAMAATLGTAAADTSRPVVAEMRGGAKPGVFALRRCVALALLAIVALAGTQRGRADAIAAPHAPGQPQPRGYLVHADGSGSVRLPDGVSRLVWAPAGERFAMVQAVGGTATVSVADAADPDTSVTVFQSTAGDPADLQWAPDGSARAILEGVGLQVVRADGSGAPRQVADHVYAFAWTPDGTKLTLVQWDGEPGHGESLTSVSAADGTAVDRILPVQTGVCPSRLAWSPDGTLLAFSAGIVQNPVCGDRERTVQGLWLWDAPGHALRQLEKQPVASQPHWTADNRIVVERKDDPFARSIAVYTSAGEAQVLATYQDNCREPQDLGTGVQVGGDTLLYLDTSGDLPQITLMPLSGGDPLLLSAAGRYTALPLLSPDGSAVAYSSAGDGDFADLAIAGTDGTPRVAVAGNGLSLRAESWSADGSLLFVSAQDGSLRRCARVDQ
jgi:dipeptidyl aminopeptidase/acylaminoacyl peptidase